MSKCNECDGDGIGHSPECALSAHEKLDQIIEILHQILHEITGR